MTKGKKIEFLLWFIGIFCALITILFIFLGNTEVTTKLWVTELVTTGNWIIFGIVLIGTIFILPLTIIVSLIIAKQITYFNNKEEGVRK